MRDAVDLSNLQSAASRIKEVVRSGGKVIIIDARGLPHRPRNPYKSIIEALERISISLKITIVYYTDDPRGKPRWVNPGGAYIKCI